jgi:hypothetical protein
MKSSTRRLILVNTIAFLGVLLINYLANALPLNGKNTGELSDQYPNLFTPAGLTFSIWGIIYLWLMVFIGYQLVALFRSSLAVRVEPIVDKIGWYFAATCVFNVAWMFAWHWEQMALSVLIMLGFLLTLLRQNNLGHGLAVAWALFGIYLKRSDAPETGSEMVAMAALGAMVLVLVVTGMRWRRWTTY